MFENLTSKIESAFSFFNKSTQLDEKQVDEGLRKIRQALLESDVALSVAKEFIANVKPKAIGQEVLKSITPGQLLVKIVYDELVKILGSEKSEINLNTVPPAKILVVGLQGSGKTTTSVKIAKFIEKNFNKKVMLSSLDVYRPAAQKQLELLGSQNNIQTIPIIEGQLPIEITQRTLAAASLSGSDVIIFDTAGRTQIDSVMMSELNNLKKIINPIETFLVADSLTGQDAVNIAGEFKKTVDLTGIILTRIDGDGKGGAALSMKSVANCPIKFLGVGEKIEDFEIFHPERIANRILGMGDVVSLVEKVSENLKKEEVEELEENFKKGQFTFNDFGHAEEDLHRVGAVESVALRQEVEQLGDLLAAPLGVHAHKVRVVEDAALLQHGRLVEARERVRHETVCGGGGGSEAGGGGGREGRREGDAGAGAWRRARLSPSPKASSFMWRSTMSRISVRILPSSVVSGAVIAMAAAAARGGRGAA